MQLCGITGALSLLDLLHKRKTIYRDKLYLAILSSLLTDQLLFKFSSSNLANCTGLTALLKCSHPCEKLSEAPDTLPVEL